MPDKTLTVPRFDIVIYDDKKTPFSFVSQLISHVFGVPAYAGEDTARHISRVGKHQFGPFAEAVAQAILAEAKEQIAANGHPLVIEVLKEGEHAASQVETCSFCGKNSATVVKMIQGSTGAICDGCVVICAGTLNEEIESTRFQHTYQLLDWHFGDVSPDSFVKTNRNYPGRVRADLQLAIESLFDSHAIRAIGIKQQHSHEQIDLTTLWTKGRNAHGLAPISFEELDIGEAQPVQCQLNGLWLLKEGDHRYAAVLSRESDYGGGFTIFLEISGPQGVDTADISRRVFDAIETSIRQARSYRGKVLSLEQSPHYGGSSTGITVHKMPSVRREDVILPKRTIEDLDRTIIRFCDNRSKLRAMGLSTKRGVMFYGPPGTGKSHTIKYLASQLQGHTTFVVTAEQIGLLPEYFSLARLLQPVIFVIEDADLLARARESMNSPAEEALLNHLLNEMDGLKEDADILFVLSTNKPQALEEALISRPGRIDQLIEFPNPSDECRHRLMHLYGGTLSMSQDLRDTTVKRTDGVSAAFIKELMRRLAQYSIERGDDGRVTADDLDQSIEEMLFSHNVLNRSVLGAGEAVIEE